MRVVVARAPAERGHAPTGAGVHVDTVVKGAARRYAPQLQARGKKGGVIGCALAHRANKIAFALVRDQTSYQRSRWA